MKNPELRSLIYSIWIYTQKYDWYTTWFSINQIDLKSPSRSISSPSTKQQNEAIMEYTNVSKEVRGIDWQWLMSFQIVNYPPSMRGRSDVSFWSHLSRDIADHIETSSRRGFWYVNETDLFVTLLRRLTGT